MPFTYKIEPTLGLILYTGFDTNSTEMLRAEKAASNDPMRLPSMKIIVDLSQAELDISLNDVYEAIKMNSERMKKGGDLESTAFISHSRFAELMGDTFRLIGEGLPLHFGIFSTLPDAIKWLGLWDKEVIISETLNEMMTNLKKYAVV